MNWDSLTADTTVQEYECIDPPKENHIREDQAGLLLYDSFVQSIGTNPILVSRKTLSDEEFDLEKTFFAEYVTKHGHYHFSFFLGELDRLYNAYCWQRYKEKKKVILEFSYFRKIIFEWIYGDSEKNEDGSSLSSNELERNVEIETIEKTEEPNNENEGNGLHVFDEAQMNIRLSMYKEAIYARHVEFYYGQLGDFPEPEWIMDIVKPKVTHQLTVMKRFIAAGQSCEELNGRMSFDDCFFSFEEDKFLFTYGKSVYKFTIIGEAFYLKGEKVELSSFFKTLRDENKRVWKHAIRLGKLFERKGISYCHSNSDRYFFLYRIIDEDDVFYLRYKQAEMTILWDKRHFYRMNGEKIEVPSILIHEMIELDGSRKKAQLKAKQYFQMFLTKQEKQQFIKTKSVFVKGRDYDYLFCPEITFNSVIRIDNVTGEKVSMCVMFNDPYIPRYDVIASALLMVKTGQEEQLNAIANSFECSEDHQNILKKYAFI